MTKAIYEAGQPPACPKCGYIHDDPVQDFVVPNSGKAYVTRCDNCESSFETQEVSAGKFEVRATDRKASCLDAL